MALTKEQKKEIIEDLKEKFKKQKAMIFVDFTGLKVKELSELRKKLKASESELRVAKKTLLRLVFKEEGLKIDTGRLKGEIALVFGFKDKISSAKTVYQFWLEHRLPKILGGFFENEFREAQEIITLAQLPTREELLSKLVATINAPVPNFVNVLQGNTKGLIFALSAIKK